MGADSITTRRTPRSAAATARPAQRPCVLADKSNLPSASSRRPAAASCTSRLSQPQPPQTPPSSPTRALGDTGVEDQDMDESSLSDLEPEAVEYSDEEEADQSDDSDDAASDYNPRAAAANDDDDDDSEEELLSTPNRNGGLPTPPASGHKRKRGPGFGSPRTPKRNRLFRPGSGSGSSKGNAYVKASSTRIAHVRSHATAITDTTTTMQSQRDLDNANVTMPQLNSMTRHQRAKRQLHVGSTPDKLPGREDEFDEILNYVVDAIQTRKGNCVYIAGSPGTGKTATVRAVMRRLNQYTEAGKLQYFRYLEVNGMKLGDPRDIYTMLWEAIRPETDKKRVSSQYALAALTSYFSSRKPGTGPPSPGRWRTGKLHSSTARHSTVLLMDELDQLVNVRQDVLYNLCEWSRSQYSRLVVLAVANTFDLPERMLSAKVQSRLGLDRVTFQTYTQLQLQRIVQSRLGMPDPKAKASDGEPARKAKPTSRERAEAALEQAARRGCADIFQPDAIKMASIRVSSVTGDARRMLDVCRRAIEAVEARAEAEIDQESQAAAARAESSDKHSHASGSRRAPSRRQTERTAAASIKAATAREKAISQRCQQVKIQDVVNVFTSMLKSAKSKHIAALSTDAKLLLIAIVKQVRSSGLAQVRLGDVFKNFDVMRSTKNVGAFCPSKGEQTSGLEDMDVFVNFSEIEWALADLCQAGVVIAVGTGSGHGRAGINGRVMLGIQEDDVRLAFQLSKETQLTNLLK